MYLLYEICSTALESNYNIIQIKALLVSKIHKLSAHYMSTEWLPECRWEGEQEALVTDVDV